MQHLLQDVQSLHEREVIQLNHTLAAQEKNHQHLTQQWMDAQREVADQQTKVMELQHEVERLHDHHQTLTSQYTSALQQHDTVVSQLHHQETVLRQSLQEWQRKAQLAESQLLSLQTQESKVLGECQVLTQELERRKEQEKRTLARHEEALRQVEKQVQLKIEKLTSLHEEELNTQVTLLQRKYDDLNQLLSKKEREWEDTTRRWEQKKMDLESHYKQALHRVECEEKEKLKNLQRDHHQLQLEKETLQKELDRVTYTAQTSARDLETKSERWQHDRRQWDETHQSFLRQLKDVTLELQKEKDQSKLAQDTVRQVRDEMKGVIESKDRLQREHLQSCQALDQARERVKVLEEVERRRKLDSLEKLRSLEHAFGAYVRDATGSQHHEL
ncbi:hypothetical protein HMI55_006597 [Coelomomyces lativittatus]|nr:hypothetical protein HMI56_000194 [Coelomomyces lativittatus]KAJ1511442.1 hypothetical protein HMI55_006597 [Coelomomyces lativittatus]